MPLHLSSSTKFFIAFELYHAKIRIFAGNTNERFRRDGRMGCRMAAGWVFFCWSGVGWTAGPMFACWAAVFPPSRWRRPRALATNSLTVIDLQYIPRSKIERGMLYNELWLNYLVAKSFGADVAGRRAFRRRSLFFRCPATLFSVQGRFSSPVGRFSGTCDGTPSDLQRRWARRSSVSRMWTVICVIQPACF